MMIMEVQKPPWVLLTCLLATETWGEETEWIQIYVSHSFILFKHFMAVMIFFCLNACVSNTCIFPTVPEQGTFRKVYSMLYNKSLPPLHKVNFLYYRLILLLFNSPRVRKGDQAALTCKIAHNCFFIFMGQFTTLNTYDQM